MIWKKLFSLKKKFNDEKIKNEKFLIIIFFFLYFILTYLFCNSTPLIIFLITFFFEKTEINYVNFYYCLIILVTFKKYIFILLIYIKAEFDSLKDTILFIIEKKYKNFNKEEKSELVIKTEKQIKLIIILLLIFDNIYFVESLYNDNYLIFKIAFFSFFNIFIISLLFLLGNLVFLYTIANILNYIYLQKKTSYHINLNLEKKTQSKLIIFLIIIIPIKFIIIIIGLTVFKILFFIYMHKFFYNNKN